MPEESKSSGFCSANEEAPQTEAFIHERSRMPLAKTDREIRMEGLLARAVSALALYAKLSKDSLKCMILPMRLELEPTIDETTKNMLGFVKECEAILAEK